MTAFDFKDGRVSALCHTDRSIKIFDIDNPSIPQVIRIRHDQDYYTVCDGRDSTYYLYAMNGDNRIVRVGFDYDGNPVKELIMEDNLEATSFHVDELRKKMYVAVSDSEPYYGTCR